MLAKLQTNLYAFWPISQRPFGSRYPMLTKTGFKTRQVYVYLLNING